MVYKPRVAVGLVQGPIHFMFNNGDYDEELDTLGMVVYKYQTWSAATDPLATNSYVLLDDRWQFVKIGTPEIWDALQGLRKKAGRVGNEARKLRSGVKTDPYDVIPLHGE